MLFALIISGATFFIKRYIKMIKTEKERHEKDMIAAIEKKLDDQKEDMSIQMAECHANLLSVVQESEEKSFAEDEKIHEEINVLKGGLLSLEGRNFKEDCRNALQPEHIITLEEYEALQAEHIVYNSLGGNHEGDGLFKMVEAKYQSTLDN